MKSASARRFRECCSLAVAADPSDLSLTCQRHRSHEVGHQRKEVGQPIRFSAKNQNCDVPAREVLLVFEPFIHRHEDFEASPFRQTEQDTFFLPPKPASGTV